MAILVLAMAGTFGALASPRAGAAEPSANAGTAAVPDPDQGRSVRVSVVVQEKGADARIYDFVTTTDGAPLRLTVGSRIPIPVTSSSTEDGNPVTSYQYQDIGFSAKMRVVDLGEGRLRVEGNLEDSLLADLPGTGGMPVVEQHTQDFRSVMEVDSSLDLTRLTSKDGSEYAVTIHVSEL